MVGIVHVYEWSAPETAETTPVVLIPGRSSGVPMWSANLPGFVETHRVLAFDALGDAGTKHFSAELPTPPLSTEQAARLTMPVYVGLAGRDSLAGGDDVAQKVIGLLPHAQVQTWKNATHSLPMQEAEQLQLVLTDFWAASQR